MLASIDCLEQFRPVHYLSLWAIWCYYNCFSTGGSLIPYGSTIMQNPKDQQDKDNKEATGAAGAATVTATPAVVGEEKDFVRIYSYSSCTCQRRKSPQLILFGAYIIL